MSPARRVVVTGGPGTGKTTLVEELARRGHATVPEAAIQVIEELNRELGLEGQKRWRTEEREAFQLRVLRRQEELEAAAPDEGLVFLDRGRADGIAYCRHFGLPVPAALEASARSVRYDRVLCLEPLPDFTERPESGRTSRREDSLALGRELARVWRELGYAVVPLPALPVPERADRALELADL